MNAWRLEWYRLVRTRRLLALVGVFALFGFAGPLLAVFLDELVASGGGGIVIDTPDPTPALAMEQFVSNAAQIGLLVALVVAANALNIDTRPELGAFFRTRVPETWRLLAPRYLVATAAVVAAWLVGVLAAWYETAVLIEAPDATAVLAGAAYTALYLAFATAVVALAAHLTRNLLTTVAVTVVALLALPVAAVAQALAPWLPSHLVGSLPALVAGEGPGEFARAASTTVVATGACLAGAVAAARRREL